MTPRFITIFVARSGLCYFFRWIINLAGQIYLHKSIQNRIKMCVCLCVCVCVCFMHDFLSKTGMRLLQKETLVKETCVESVLQRKLLLERDQNVNVFLKGSHLPCTCTILPLEWLRVWLSECVTSKFLWFPLLPYLPGCHAYSFRSKKMEIWYTNPTYSETTT
jgi:hypothetical protein